MEQDSLELGQQVSTLTQVFPAVIHRLFDMDEIVIEEIVFTSGLLLPAQEGPGKSSFKISCRA